MKSSIDTNSISNDSIAKHLTTEVDIGVYYCDLLENLNLKSIKLKIDALIEIVKKCDWAIWFEMAENSRYEWGGTLLYSAELDMHINPIISMGTEYKVHCPGIVSIHSHPLTSLVNECVDAYKPSPADWCASIDKGAQIVVTKWGLFLHEYMGNARTFLPFAINDKWRFLDVNMNDYDYKLLFIHKKELVRDTNDIYLDIKFNCCKPPEPIISYKVNNNMPRNIKYSPDAISEIIDTINSGIEYNVNTILSVNVLYKFERKVSKAIYKMLKILSSDDIIPAIDIICIEINFDIINDIAHTNSIQIISSDNLLHSIHFNNSHSKYSTSKIIKLPPTIDDISSLMRKKRISYSEALFMVINRYKINFQ